MSKLDPTTNSISKSTSQTATLRRQLLGGSMMLMSIHDTVLDIFCTSFVSPETLKNVVVYTKQKKILKKKKRCDPGWRTHFIPKGE